MTKDASRPSSISEKEKFSSGGKRHIILLRGKWGLAIDKVILWATGYSLVTKQYCAAMGNAYQPTLLLKTIGAKSGELRLCGLPFFEVGDSYVVRGSNGGGPTDPHWVHNVRANEAAWVRINRKWRPVTAAVASGKEREVLFEKLCEMAYTTRRYQDMCAPRELPLVVLRARAS